MKNVHVFSAVLPSMEDVAIKLAESEGMLFAPLLEIQEMKLGFNPVQPLIKLENGYKINFVYSWKKLPRMAVNDEAYNRVETFLTENPDQFDSEEEKTLYAEKVFDDVLAEYCAKVLPETVHFTAYYHVKHEKLIIDAKEDFSQRSLALLVTLLGSIETTTLHCSGISNSLTTNLLSSLHNEQERLDGLRFAGFETGDLLVLGNANKDVVRFKGDYPLDNVQELLEDGYEVKQINLSKDGLAFTLTEKFKIKQIKSTFDVDDFDSLDDEDFNLHHSAVELELLVDHCNTLREFFDKQKDTEIEEHTTIQTEPISSKESSFVDKVLNGEDPLYDEAVLFVKETRRVSISGIQRKFRIGYNRSARIVEQMEENNIISEPGHNGSREILQND